ncbi:MAG: alanine dehydrogenase [Thermoplasmata archaeon]
MTNKLLSANVLLLSTNDLRKLLDMNDVLTAVETAFRLRGLGRVQMPPKMYVFFEKYNGDIRCMPSYIEDISVSAVKIVNVHPDNPKKHKMRTVMATIILIDPETGAPIAVMDGSHITDMRTGAASGVASKYLARKDARTLGIIGAGTQSRTQLLAILDTFMKLDEVRIYDILPAASNAFCEEIRKNFSKRIQTVKVVDGPKDAVADMDIVCTCTPSRKPIVKDAWVSKGQHFNCIGADAPGKQELDGAILKRAKVVIDDWEQASHSGEINVPISQGVFSQKDVYGNIGDIVAGKIPGRTSHDEITIFCSTGLAIQDAVTAKLAYDAAKRKKAGHSFEMIQP